ncbi:MAG: thioredoxin domain-containing protein [Pirellulaceae bacterium]
MLMNLPRDWQQCRLSAALVGLLLVVACLMEADVVRWARAQSPANDVAGGDDPPGGHTNRLATASSPYLLQHARNPVDWYPWGDEALALAKRENKPIFLSIGYSSCHWCHVMAHESFEDAEIAAFMNEHFVCIKVDREERPDIDDIYMTSVQMLTRRGGWPLSVFLTPDAKPFFGGTYFPPRDGMRGGATGFLTILRKLADVWKTQEKEVRATADRVTDAVGDQMQDPPAGDEPLDADWLPRVHGALVESFDEQFGGFGYDPNDGARPKFPEPSNLAFLSHQVANQRDKQAADMLDVTLTRMAMGGIWDHLGGGFHRYSVDRFWRIPHFEKMLYDNGQLLSLYAQAYARTKRPEFARVVEQTIGFLRREMAAQGGGFYAALDADSEHEEGKYYRWTREEWTAILGDKDALLFERVYASSERPNFEAKYFVPQITKSWRDLAEREGVTQAELQARLEPLRQSLLDARVRRVRPGTDTKVLTSWNGLAIRGLADAGRLLDRPEYTELAAETARFLLQHCRDERQRLYHLPLASDGANGPRFNAYLDDYAFLCDGLVALHQATGDKQWLQAAMQLMEQQETLFGDEQRGGYYFTTADHETLIVRSKRYVDEAIPSGNAVTALNLLYLAQATGRDDFRQRADRTIQSSASLLQRVPAAATLMATAVAEKLRTRK